MKYLIIVKYTKKLINVGSKCLNKKQIKNNFLGEEWKSNEDCICKVCSLGKFYLYQEEEEFVVIPNQLIFWNNVGKWLLWYKFQKTYMC